MRTGGLKIPSMISAQNAKSFFVIKTKCTFLSFKHSFISFQFHMPAVLLDDTIFSSALMHEVIHKCSYEILVDIAGFHYYRLATMAEIG